MKIIIFFPFSFFFYKKKEIFRFLLNFFNWELSRSTLTSTLTSLLSRKKWNRDFKNYFVWSRSFFQSSFQSLDSQCVNISDVYILLAIYTFYLWGRLSDDVAISAFKLFFFFDFLILCCRKRTHFRKIENWNLRKWNLKFEKLKKLKNYKYLIKSCMRSLYFFDCECQR